MSRTTKRFLSILLTAALVLSLGITGWAIDDITIVEPTKPARETDERVTTGFEGGTELELEDIDPDELAIPKLGALDEEITVPEETKDPDEIVRVSIALYEPSVLMAGYGTQSIGHNGSAIAYRDMLKQQQADVEAAISAAGISMNVKWNLTLAVNIISAEVRYGDIERIADVAGVKEVWLENRYEPQIADLNTVNTTEHMVGAVEVWNSGYTGAGTKIAIVDTGTNQDHLSFDPEAFLYALEQDGLEPDLMTWDDISAVADQLNVSVNASVYKNAKIPYAYNYVDGNYTTDHDSDSQGEHGSHVSGIAAANRYVKVDGEFVDAAEAVWAVGVAPDAQILTMKVFGAGGGAYDSDYMSAIEDAIVLGADSVNLSLGSASPGFTYSRGYQDVMDSLVGSGTVVSISAGNSYNWGAFLPSGIPYIYLEDVSLHTGGSPGSFVNSLGVAAAQNVGAIAAPLIFNGDQTIVYTETAEDYSNEPISTIPGTYEYVLVNGPGVDDNDHVGQEGDAFLALGPEVLKGKVALCYRGTSSFFAKANAAVAQGAVAVIIINNQDGVIRMNLTGYEYDAPVVSILQADGATILANSEERTDANGNTYYVGSVEITSEDMPIVTTDREDAYITEFSSWGVPGSLVMKPEITAPGGDIYSVNGMTDDGYEFMSGTSMAAPHVTGMAALVGQYIRENNLEEITGQNRRTLINSLLMSTATPMIVNGQYLSILQQGSGLGDTFAATQAKSYILMGEDATDSWADGKVKVELGQDAAREGVYTFSFSVNNFSDVEMTYQLGTDMFMQWVTSDGENLLMDTKTMYIGGEYDEAYDFEHFTPNLHDVDKDGDTDKDDVQALLDYITGLVEAEELDLDAGEMDGTDGISSYDAQLLLEWLEEAGGDNLIVPAHTSVPVTVTITYGDWIKNFIDSYFENGTWIEGFTYVVPVTETDDGEIIGVTHTIPILGFYGSYTESSMFDCVSAIDTAYGSTKESYTGNPITNYLTVNYGDGNSIFMGNPYAVEEVFPADRLAVSSETALVNFNYNLIRNAATAGWVALDAEGDVLDNGTLSANVVAAYYHVNQGVWKETGTKTAAVNTSAADLGVKEGETFTIGMFAVPEYYGMLLHPGENVTTVTAKEIASLLADGELGEGACLGYTFVVDDEAPQILSVKLSDDKSEISVTAKDDKYLAYIAIADILGNTVFIGSVPEQSKPGEEVTVTFDISDLGLDGAVAAFAGDYAANEDASLIRLSGEGSVPVTITEKHEIYKPATKIENGRDYIIVSADTTGTVKALESRYGTGYYLLNSSVTVQEGTLGDYTGKYIDVDDVIDGVRWAASGFGNGSSLQCVADGAYIYPTNNNVRPAGMTDATPWNYSGNQLNCLNYYTVDIWITWNASASNFYCNFTQPTNAYCYLYVRDEYTTETVVDVDPDNASSVTVHPDDLLLLVGQTETLKATVAPLVLSDKSVTWSSADETVATVDANGVVTAVGAGETEIIATSNATPTVSGSAHVKVLAPEPMDVTIYGQVAFGDDDVEFVSIDLNDMSTVNLSGDNAFSYFYGGAQSGDYIYGNDIDNDFHRYIPGDGYSYDGSWHDVWEVIESPYAMRDGASIPNFTYYDMDNIDPETGDGTAVEFETSAVGVCSGGYLLFYDMGGLNTMTGFNISSLGNFVAITFAGLSMQDGISLYYYGLTDQGVLYIFLLTGIITDGEADYSLRYGEIGPVEGLAMSGDPTAYSMMYSAGVIDDENEEGVFIADSTIGGIYYVDLSADEVVAKFVGMIDGATNLSTLYDNYFDAAGYLGGIEVGGDDSGSIGDAYLASDFARSFPMSADVLPLQTIDYYDTEIVGAPEEIDDFEIVEIEGSEDTEIIDVVGGLDAANTAIRKPVVELDSAVLLNPSYYEDGYVQIGITTPGVDPDELAGAAVPAVQNGALSSGLFPMGDGDDEALYYNGYATLTYDPEALTYADYDVHPGLQITSFSVDEENGIIRFAYASLTPVEEGLIAVVYFEGPTENTVVTVTTEESNDDLDVGEVTEIPLVLGYTITIEDYTNGGATCDLDTTVAYEYEQEVTFTVAADQAVAVIRKDGPFHLRAVDWDDQDYRYETVECVDDEDGNHTFTFTVYGSMTICLVYKGDVNLNGKVETKDGTMVKRYVVGLDGDNYYDLDNPLKRLVADVDGNEEVEAKDGTMIARQVVGTYEIAW